MPPEGLSKAPGAGCGNDDSPVRTPRARLRQGQSPEHPAGLSDAKFPPDSFIHLDVARETIIRDIDFAFVCSPRWSGKHFDPSGNKRCLYFNMKRLHGISLDISTPFPPSLPSCRMSVP